jgi:hypothetical protein
MNDSLDKFEDIYQRDNQKLDVIRRKTVNTMAKDKGQKDI